MVNYNGPVGRIRTYLSRSRGAEIPPGTFKERIVLVGASATGIGDLRATPFGSLIFRAWKFTRM